MRLLVTMLWLVAVWVTLWESLSWANVLGGLVAASVVVTLLPPSLAKRHQSFRPIPALKLTLVFLWELVKASAFMAWEVVTPRNRIGAAVVSVRLSTDVAGVITAVANMVSLTPGTLTLDVDEQNQTIFIHVLHLKSVQATRDAVLNLERLTMAAFPTDRHRSTRGRPLS